MSEQNVEKACDFAVGDRVKVPPSNWRPSTTGTVVDQSEFCASGPIYVKRDDTGFTVGYRRDVLRRIPSATPDAERPTEGEVG